MRLWPRGGLWRHGDFLRLWGAQTISQFGSQVSLLALPLVAVIVLDASTFEVALLGAVDFLPFLVFSLPAGVWVDRLPRRPLLVVADLGRGVTLATVPAVALFDALTIWQLYAVGFATGTMTVLFDVAYQSYLPSLIGREHLLEGNSKLEISRSSAQVGGPGAAGILIGAITAPYAVLVDAVSFVASAFLLARIRTAEAYPERQPGASAWREVGEGIRYVLGDPRWRAFALYVSSVNFFATVVFSVFIVFGVRELGLSAELLGLLFALANLGALAGAVAAGRVARQLGIGRTLIAAGVLGGPPMLLIAAAPENQPIPFLVASLALVTLGTVLFNITGVSLVQALTPERILGRMNASRRFMVWGTIPLGSVVGGALGTSIGLRETIFVGALGASLCFVFLVFSPLRTIRRLPEPAAALTEALRLPLETQVPADA